MVDLADKLEPIARAALGADEPLVGCCVATWQTAFSGRMVAIAVAPTRIVVQPVDRRWNARGDAIALPRERIARAHVTGGGGDWITASATVMDAVSVALDLSTSDGIRMKLMLMTGEGPLGRLGGGDIQRTGLEALLAYLGPSTTG